MFRDRAERTEARGRSNHLCAARSASSYTSRARTGYGSGWLIRAKRRKFGGSRRPSERPDRRSVATDPSYTRRSVRNVEHRPDLRAGSSHGV